MKRNVPSKHLGLKLIVSVICDLFALWLFGWFTPKFPNTTLGSGLEMFYGILMLAVLILLPKFICRKIDSYYNNDK